MYQFHFTQLQFQIRFLQSGHLPEYKTSALRGGIGQMLLQMYCVWDQEKCEKCICQKRCIVQNVMYAPFQIKPEFVTEKESAGFTLYCEDNRRYVAHGDVMWFRLIFYGDTAAYFNPVLQSIHALGAKGLGNEALPFEIVAVQNRMGQDILQSGNIYMEKLLMESVSDYIAERKRELSVSDKIRISFRSPCTIKYQGDFITEFHPEAVLRAIARRIYMYHLFEGIVMEPIVFRNMPNMVYERAYTQVVPRYSHRNKGKVKLYGIVGEMELENISEEILDVLLAGEITQVGKNTKFGFGVIRCLKEGR